MSRQDRESRLDEWAALVDASVPESAGDAEAGDPPEFDRPHEGDAAER